MSKQPTLIAYYVQENGKRRNIGAAWPNKDGSGFFVKLNYLPTKGTFELLVNRRYQDEVVDNFSRHVR